MADLTITPANVVPGNGAKTRTVTAGATIAAGQAVYRDPVDGKYKLADCDNATAAVRVPAGIALNGAANGQPLEIITEGPVALGAILTAGVAYFLSPNPGGIAPAGDLGSGDFPSILGIAGSTSVLKVGIQQSGVALA